MALFSRHCAKSTAINVRLLRRNESLRDRLNPQSTAAKAASIDAGSGPGYKAEMPSAFISAQETAHVQNTAVARGTLLCIYMGDTKKVRMS
jgi:hypothetical protein